MLTMRNQIQNQKSETEQVDGLSKFEVKMRGRLAMSPVRDRVRERVYEHISLRHIEEWSRSCA